MTGSDDGDSRPVQHDASGTDDAPGPDAAGVLRWSVAALAGLEAGRDEIDALNVFPVPDADTGTNMAATMSSAHRALAEAMAAPDPPVTAHDALQTLSRGAALGAIGNSGFILSQLLRGLAEATAEASAAGAATEPKALDSTAAWTADQLGSGLEIGTRLGRQAVVTPVEGTILSVAGAAAEAAAGRLAAGPTSFAELCEWVVPVVDSAVTRTPSQLPDLAEAGVVDAGGRGLLVILDALARAVGAGVAALRPVELPLGRGRSSHAAADAPDLGFEVQYLLDAPVAALERLRADLSRTGDSIAIVPTGTDVAGAGWKVHVHVHDIGAAIEAGLVAGRPSRIEVTGLTDQPTPTHSARPPAHVPQPLGRRFAVVAVAPGEGLAHLFAGEGVHVVEGNDLDAADVVDVIRASRARDVVLLPNASRITGVAEAAAARVRAQGVRVTVVPTRSPVQGLAAVAVHDPARRYDDDVVAMTAAAAATRFAQVTIARSRALTAVGMCEAGDVLGLIDGEVVEVGRGLLAVAFNLVDRLLGVGAELMTVLVGEGAPKRAGELIEAHVRGRAPLTDVTVYFGGQPDHPVIIGVE